MRFLLLCILAVSSLTWGAGSSSEYALKAALLKKVVSFVEWPQERGFNTPRVCVYGADPFGDYLQEAFAGTDSLIVNLDLSVTQVDSCDLLWVSDSVSSSYPNLLAALAQQPVLTVSDIPRFAQRGGILNLRLINSRVRFVVNAEVSEQAGLHISHKLLRLAEIVETERSSR